MTQIKTTAESSSLHKLQQISQRILSLGILFLLLTTIMAGTSENMNAQMLKLGAYIWDDYFVLRGEKPIVNCKLNINIPERVAELEKEHEAENAGFNLFETEFDKTAVLNSLNSQLELCQKQHHEAEIYNQYMSVWVKVFRSIERGLANVSLIAIAKQKLALILLLSLSAVVTTWKRNHIAFRSIQTRLDNVVSNTGQFIANACLGISTFAFYKGSYASGTVVTHPELMIILIIACVSLCILNVYQLNNPEKPLQPGGKPLKAFLTIPVHTMMLLVANFYFFVNEHHLPGTSIYFTQIFQLTNLHLVVGLYIFVGMLLKETLIGTKLFGVFKPWNLPPEMLAFVAIAIMAFPTAYTGASGIMIIAMGAVVYQEMRRIGARRQLSLAVTAMTGSSGVVLRPCLLVVGIAILNKEVVTDELYHWGFRVFLLGMVIFAVFAMITRKDPLKITPAREALLPSIRLLGPVLPYIGILAGMLIFYQYVLDTRLDEFTAPVVLPIIVLAVLIFERRFSRDFVERNQIACVSPTVSSAFIKSVDNSAMQIGAILMLMACSFTVGGVIERSGGVMGFHEGFTSVYATMAFLVLLLVFIGMIMDPFGALILVSGTIAPIAYHNGIHPIHFWMMCLMAFELGYLTPPVSLNHLLTRQVVGDEEVDLALTEGDNFYYRHERILLPLLVMGTTLLTVAFVPLIYLN